MLFRVLKMLQTKIRWKIITGAVISHKVTVKIG